MTAVSAVVWLRTVHICFFFLLLTGANFQLLRNSFDILLFQESRMEDYKFLFKVVLIGNAGVGKSDNDALFDNVDDEHFSFS